MSDEQQGNDQAAIQAFAAALSATVIEGALSGKIPPYHLLLGMCLAIHNVALSICGGNQVDAVALADEAWGRIKTVIDDPSTEARRGGAVSVEEQTEGGLLVASPDGMIH